MKWILSAIIAAAVSSAAAAQSGQEMAKPATGDKMHQPTYVGCVEAINHGGTLMLTHVGHAGMETTHDHMAMNKDDAMMKKEEPSAMDDANMHPTAPSALILAGSPDLKKHVGQRVSVKGSLSKGPADTMRNDVETLSVSSLKVVAKSCS